jgi:hypothetical protein
VVQAGDVIDPPQAKSVFLNRRTTIARPLSGEEPRPWPSPRSCPATSSAPTMVWLTG